MIINKHCNSSTEIVFAQVTIETNHEYHEYPSDGPGLTCRHERIFTGQIPTKEIPILPHPEVTDLAIPPPLRLTRIPSEFV